MRIIRLLKHELSSDAVQWIERGIVSTEQANAILALYGGEVASGERRAKGHFVLLALAALFVGLSAILFISGNWDEIPRNVRMLGLIGLTLVCNVVGIRYYSAERLDYARIWFFLGSLLYGASIFLIAQIYHLGEHYPDGILYWALGVLPFALVTKSVLLMLLGTVLSQIWLLVEGSEGFFPAAYPIFAFVGFWFCLAQRKSILIFLLSVVGVVTYGEFVLDRLLNDASSVFLPGVEHIYFTTGIFILLYFAGCFLEKRSTSSMLVEYGLALRIWALRFGLITLFVLSFEEPWKELVRASLGAKGFIASWLLIVVLAPIAWLLRDVGPQVDSLSTKLVAQIKEYSSTFAFLAVYILVNLLVLAASKEFLGVFAFVLVVLTNLVLLGMGVWLLCKAFATESSSYFYLGLGVILFTALLRYVDLIGEYLGGSLLFLVAAGIMFLAAHGWRRYMKRKGGSVA
jgi:uncharacterized membrane protein